MSLFKKRNTFDSPFDDYKLRLGLVGQDNVKYSPDYDLTGSGAILLVLTTLSLATEFCCARNFIMCAFVIFTMFILWLFTLRFAMLKRFPTINIVLNYCFFVGLGALAGRHFTSGVSNLFPITSIPLVVGLSLYKYDENVDKRLRDNAIIPFIMPFVFNVLNFLVLSKVGKTEPFIMVFLSALEILLLSVVISKLSDRLVLFAGAELTEVSSIPQNGRRDAIRFITARVIDLAIYMVVLTSLLFIYSNFGEAFPKWIYCIIIVSVFALYNVICEFTCKRESKDELFTKSPFVFELSKFMNTILQCALIYLFFIKKITQLSDYRVVLYSSVCFPIYVFLLGFTASYKRRLVFADINVYSRGVTHFLLIIGVILMICSSLVVI